MANRHAGPVAEVDVHVVLARRKQQQEGEEAQHRREHARVTPFGRGLFLRLGKPEDATVTPARDGAVPKAGIYRDTVPKEPDDGTCPSLASSSSSAKTAALRPE